MNHYYFKYLKDNWGLSQNLKRLKKETIEDLIGEVLILSIYFGNWKASQRDQGIDEIIKKKRNSSMSISQIDLFYSLIETKDNYFWIFHKDKILQIRIIGHIIYDGPIELNDPQDDSLPKSIDGIVEKIYYKIRLPEMFSNINSNQGYNRKTITKLVKKENEIANTLITNKKIMITKNNLIDFLSPTEFETLIFLIFSNESVLCSSYRGGTLKDYDLRICVEKDFHNFKVGYYWLQIKYKDEYKNINDIYTIYKGQTDLDMNLLGKDWVNNRISENENVERWLTKMIYDYTDIYTLENV